VPHTDDGRVLFVIPWHQRVLVGTTDTAMPHADIEPRALPEEVDFILRNAARYLDRQPTRADVLSVFAGQRPLVQPVAAGAGRGRSKSISREHSVLVSDAGLVTIVGGKWTTYRKMAERVVDMVMQRLSERGERVPAKKGDPDYKDSGIIFEDGFGSVDKVLHPSRLEFYSTKPPLLSVLAAEFFVVAESV
jgi:glycerol-3-phosphate dehydrogenase